MTQFLIVRHGETLWNRERRIQGQGNSPLSPGGVRQAHAVARRLAQAGAVRIVASDLGRTVETAQPMAAATGLRLATDARLRERAFGIFEGLTPDEIAARHPEHHARWQTRDAGFEIPGGESLNQLQARVRAAFEALAAPAASAASVPGAGAGPVIIVTHGGVLDAVYRIAVGVAPGAPRTWQLLNASINQVSIDGSGWQVGPWGDIGHLAGAEDDFS